MLAKGLLQGARVTLLYCFLSFSLHVRIGHPGPRVTLSSREGQLFVHSNLVKALSMVTLGRGLSQLASI